MWMFIAGLFIAHVAGLKIHHSKLAEPCRDYRLKLLAVFTSWDVLHGLSPVTLLFSQLGAQNNSQTSVSLWIYAELIEGFMQVSWI